MALLDLGDRIIAKPNNSLPPEGGIKLLVVLLVMVLVVVLGFIHIGAWLVMPFAGLELLAFACAFHYVAQHADDFERITINQDNLIIEKSNNKQLSEVVFHRYWAKISVRTVSRVGGLHAKTGLFISSHGNEVEFGKNLISDEQRAALAFELKQKLKNI